MWAAEGAVIVEEETVWVGEEVGGGWGAGGGVNTIQYMTLIR